MEEKLKPVDLPDKHQRLVGLIITEWARLENVLNYVLWSYLGVSQKTGRRLTSDLPAASLIPILKAVAAEKLSRSKSAKLKTMLDKAEHFRKERNDMAHATWQIPDPGGSPYLSIGEVTKRGRFDLRSREFRIPGMRKQADNIRGLTEDLIDFFDDLDAPPP